MSLVGLSLCLSWLLPHLTNISHLCDSNPPLCTWALFPSLSDGYVQIVPRALISWCSWAFYCATSPVIHCTNPLTKPLDPCLVKLHWWVNHTSADFSALLFQQDFKVDYLCLVASWMSYIRFAFSERIRSKHWSFGMICNAQLIQWPKIMQICSRQQEQSAQLFLHSHLAILGTFHVRVTAVFT